MRPGPRNLITDVAGIRVGNAEDGAARSGVTVVIPDEPATAAVDVRGGGPGTRETDALSPACVVEQIHGLTLSGGSAFGLDAGGGLITWLAERGRGFCIADACVPVVPGAILFDLLNGGDKDWGHEPPFRDLARQAADRAGEDIALGNSGAGFGARAGHLKGGLGSASIVSPQGHTVGALVACNAFGSPLIPGTDCFWAWALEIDGEFGGRRPPRLTGPIEFDYRFDSPPGTNTTIGVIATDAILTRAQAERVAIMAHDGYARAVRPMHTPLDGDTIFVLAMGQRAIADPIGDLARIGMLAADCIARALTRGVFEAETLGDMTSYRDLRQKTPRQSG